ncbi:MAG: response regulator [Deltaproteobacteria bacterium]|nr:MAG: response regulator [Deltaproteobacteria bacterium]
MHTGGVSRVWIPISVVGWAAFGAVAWVSGDQPTAYVDLVAAVASAGTWMVSRERWLPALIGIQAMASVAWIATSGQPGTGFVLLGVTLGALLTERRMLPLWVLIGVSAAPFLPNAAYAVAHVLSTLFGTGMGSWASQRYREAETAALLQAATLQEKNAELETSRLALEESLRLRSAFMANMSHEIRTPLNGVLAMARLMLDTRLDDGQIEMAQTIDRSGRSLLALLNDVLDWSKIDSGRLELEQVRYNPREVTEEVLELFAGAAHEKGLDLAVVFDETVPTRAMGDSQRLRQVLANLVGNAVKFTATGGVLIEVHESDGQLFYSVSDSGIGVAPERMATLFAPFIQADASTSRRFGGTGLGLAVSRRLVEAMGGEIAVESKLGSGSTFTFGVRWEPPTEEPTNLTVIARLKRRRALGVGLREYTAMAARGALGEVGMTVDFVDSLDQVAAALEKHRYHAILVSMELDEPKKIAHHMSMIDAPPFVLLANLGAAAGASGAIDLGYAGVAFAPLRARDLCVVIDAAVHGETNAERTAWSFFERSLAQRVPLSILVAEDNPTNQRVVELVLQRLGYNPAFAANGLEAVQAVRRHRYDLVLMDLLMPTMDGLEATRIILEEQRERPPVIVGLTASASQDARRDCLAAGMREVLAKPLEIAALVSTLESFADEPMSTGERPSAPSGEDQRALNALDMLLQLCGGDIDKRRVLVADFLINADQLVATMNQAIETGAREELRRAAHSLKGSSPMYGAPGLGEAAAKLETHVKEQGLDGSRRGVVVVEDELANTRSFLSDVVGL